MSESLQSHVTTFEQDVFLAHHLVHGPAGSSVPTESGQLRTFADLQAFLLASYNQATVRTETGQNRQAAQAAATQAATSAQASQAALDAVLLSGGIYPDLTTAQAGTAPGQYFSVPSPEESEHLILYRRTEIGADEIKRYPSLAALAGMRDLLASLSASLIDTQAIIASRLAFS